MQTVPLISYQEFISIVLTALAVMLAILGVGIGVLAIWGYVSLREGLQTMATKHVERAMEKKLGEYPTPTDLVEKVRSMLVAHPAPNQVAPASKADVQQQPGGVQGSSVSDMYPGEEPDSGHD